MVSVRRVIVMGGAMGRRRMRWRRMSVVIVAVPGPAARMTLTRPGKRDDRRDDAAKQWEKDDRLIHLLALFFSAHDHARQPFIRLMSSTAIEPRLR